MLSGAAHIVHSSVVVCIVLWKVGTERELEFREGAIFRRWNADETLDGIRFNPVQMYEFRVGLAGILLASYWFWYQFAGFVLILHLIVAKKNRTLIESPTGVLAGQGPVPQDSLSRYRCCSQGFYGPVAEPENLELEEIEQLERLTVDCSAEAAFALSCIQHCFVLWKRKSYA